MTDTSVLPTLFQQKVGGRIQLTNYIKLTMVLVTPLHGSSISLNFVPSHIHEHTYTFRYSQLLHRHVSVFCLEVEDVKKQGF